MRRRVMIAAGMVGLAMAQPALAQRGLGEIKIGQPFPDLTFRSMEDGSPMSIADFRGKKVVLQIFASW
ncbi:MAG: hypothetical protein IID33_09555 [Planctomycetes bacterium]|nr:hypothetical protein [Planctomycetota bacterium]